MYVQEERTKHILSSTCTLRVNTKKNQLLLLLNTNSYTYVFTYYNKYLCNGYYLTVQHKSK